MERRELGRVRLAPHQLALAQRAHEQHAETEVGGQRQDRALHLAVGRVVGHLDDLDAAGGHDLG
jgi:hypothetical protein